MHNELTAEQRERIRLRAREIGISATIALCVEGFCVVGIGGILLAVWGWL